MIASNTLLKKHGHKKKYQMDIFMLKLFVQ